MHIVSKDEKKEEKKKKRNGSAFSHFYFLSSPLFSSLSMVTKLSFAIYLVVCSSIVVIGATVYGFVCLGHYIDVEGRDKCIQQRLQILEEAEEYNSSYALCQVFTETKCQYNTATAVCLYGKDACDGTSIFDIQRDAYYQWMEASSAEPGVVGAVCMGIIGTVLCLCAIYPIRLTVEACKDYREKRAAWATQNSLKDQESRINGVFWAKESDPLLVN